SDGPVFSLAHLTLVASRFENLLPPCPLLPVGRVKQVAKLHACTPSERSTTMGYNPYSGTPAWWGALPMVWRLRQSTLHTSALRNWLGPLFNGSALYLIQQLDHCCDNNNANALRLAF